jgi:tRNA (mo5U34)-methyltransferase
VSRRILSSARARLRGLLPTHRPASDPAPTPDLTPEACALLKEVERAPIWMHALDLGHGVVTPGVTSAVQLREKWDSMGLPDLRGKSVLDIGAWDGWFSFEAERRGATRVIALDRYVWALDWEAKRRYRRECEEKGLAPEPYTQRPELFDQERLPGKYGFDLARSVYKSDVEVVVADLMTADLEALGTFDIVLYLGGLYHMEEPLTALRRVRRLTKGLAVIETAGVVVPECEEIPMFRFYPPGDKLDGDPSNFWAPNLAGLKGMCEAAGFSRVEVATRAPAATGAIAACRLTVRAYV